MAWRIVKQPNGLLARFSEVVDDFTHVNMTCEEAVILCKKEGCTPIEAALKVTRGLDDVLEDEDAGDGETRGDGLARWRDALDDIQGVHGKRVRQQRERAGNRKV